MICTQSSNKIWKQTARMAISHILANNIVMNEKFPAFSFISFIAFNVDSREEVSIIEERVMYTANISFSQYMSSGLKLEKVRLYCFVDILIEKDSSFCQSSCSTIVIFYDFQLYLLKVCNIFIGLKKTPTLLFVLFSSFKMNFPCFEPAQPFQYVKLSCFSYI